MDPGVNYTRDILDVWSPDHTSGQYPKLLGSGTTTDVLYKRIELPEVGPVVLGDTPGVGDSSPLGALVHALFARNWL